MKVLVIEDSRTTLDAVCRQLDKLGIAALPAIDGAAGLESYEREKPDLVLLDIILPDIVGFQVAERIRAREHNGEWTPIIFLTARNTDEDLERGIAAGGDDYLAKPVSATVLGSKLRAMQRILQMRGSLVALTRKLDVANRELRRLSSIDGLTGIANRRQFDETFAREWRRSVRMKRPLALVMCDIDFFKQYNDMYGHQAGDECLCRVARSIEQSVRRPGDRVTRFGGEEFTVVLPETESAGAAAMAEKVRAGIEALAVPHGGSEASKVVTIRAECAAMMPQASNRASDLVHWADAALYEAKRQGRNRVVNYTLPESG